MRAQRKHLCSRRTPCLPAPSSAVQGIPGTDLFLFPQLLAELPADQLPNLFFSPAVLGNVHDLVLKDEKIGSALARDPHHVLVVVLDPAAHNLTVH